MEDFFELNIYIPLAPTYSPETHLSEYFNSATEDILTLQDKIEINIDKVGSFKLKIFRLADDSRVEKVFSIRDTVLVFQIIVPNSPDKLKFFSSDNTPEQERLLLLKKNIAEEFKLQIFNLLVLSNISYPGGIKTQEGIIMINNINYGLFPSIYSIHRDTLDDVEKLKWPVYRTLSIHQVWQWFKNNNFSFRYHSKTKVARALNAFTYLFKSSPENVVFDLFWSLIGIEALYCNSNDRISEQIYEKVQLVLGPVTESKKKIKDMYNFRSRLVHGDINIPPNHFDYDDTDDEKFQNEMFEATVLAVAILTATLQEIVIKNGTDLNFKYILE